jgi:methionyl-tRNA formyltransferase
MNDNLHVPKYAFWGSADFSLKILRRLFESNYHPSVLLTEEDKPIGRGQQVKKSPLKLFAESVGFPIIEVQKFNDDLLDKLREFSFDFFLVAAYGRIIPEEIMKLPRFGSLNIHPSLLPKYRGPSPVQTQILQDERNMGISLMLMDNKMDHGPILAQRSLSASNLPLKASAVFELMAQEGTKLFLETVRDYIGGKIHPKEQDDNFATYTQKIKKSDGMLNLNDDPYKNYLKFLAFDIWPGVFFIVETKKGPKRVIIKDAKFEKGLFQIQRVLPAGGKEMPYEDFIRGL